MLGKALELLTPPASGMRIDMSHCIRRRFSRATCRRCEEACPSGALVLEKAPRINSALCNGCRQCEGACPTGALQGDERDLPSLACAVAKHPQPVLGCREAGVQAHVHTGCLGFLEVEGLLALSLFFPQGLSLNLTRCQGCRNGGIISKLKASFEQLRGLLGNAPFQMRVVRNDRDLRFQGIDLSRRDFFIFLRKTSADAATRAARRLHMSNEQGDGRRKSLPAQRRLLLRALPLLPADIRQRVEDQLFPSLQFRQTCTSCTGCAGICPTGAIASTSADPPQLAYSRELCTRCGICAEFCRKGGIDLRSR